LSANSQGPRYHIVGPASSGALGPSDAFVRVPEPAPEIMPTTTELTTLDRLDHWRARWGFRRNLHRVPPGLYALGRPGLSSRVFVTANYTLSFDALRTALSGRNAYVLVLDTKGVNVWCAAGKGTFGTDELVQRIAATRLGEVIDHRSLVLPQLGASGVSALEVRRRSGFAVEFGPVRARDLGDYLDLDEATPEMRRVTFGLGERAVLVPVELVHTFLPMLAGAVVLYFLSGVWGAVAAVASVLAAAAVFPLLLPYLPTAEFSTKGMILGVVASIPSVLGALRAEGGPVGRWLLAISFVLCSASVTAYLALNFTGATPLASKSGVEREMRRYIPIMAVSAAVGTLAILGLAVARWTGGRL